MMSAMLYRSRKLARSLVASALGFFLLGSNYCLMAVATDWLGAGTPPACHATVARGASHGCCTGNASRAPERPAPVHGLPCCMLLALAGGPALAKSAAIEAPIAYAPVESAPTPPVDLGTTSRVLERAGPDPSGDARVLRAGRAPPLS